MAIKIYEKFSPRANPADTNYPNGSIKNESVPGAKDGTPLDAAWGNDYAGFDAALLSKAGIVPNGSPDTAVNSQRLDALLRVFDIYGTVADIAAGRFGVGKRVTVVDRSSAVFLVVAGGIANGLDVLDAGGGNTAELVHNGEISPPQVGADVTGVNDSSLQLSFLASNSEGVNLGCATYKLDASLVLSEPKDFVGCGSKTKFVTEVGFNESIFTVSPTVGKDPKNWEIGKLSITDGGLAVNAFILDIAASGKYLSKLTLSNVILNSQLTGYFVELLNSNPNIDGLFTSVFKDNWSFGGYYMSNIGDSVYFLRNTTTGRGYGYYINELDTAANVTIRDGNCTVTGNALYVDRGSNITFDNMQVECPDPFDGLGEALVYLDHVGGGLIYNAKITNNSMNTQGNVPYCVRVNETDLVIIDGNNMYCDPTTGAHVVIDASARNTLIGNNKYFNALNGVEIEPIIVDNGVGTLGVWKDAALTLSGWVAQGAPAEHLPGYYKDSAGNVQFRGRVSGPASSVGDTLFTLPQGFRPKSKAYNIGTSGSPSNPIMQILPTGEVQILTAGVTGIYLSGIVFSWR